MRENRCDLRPMELKNVERLRNVIFLNLHSPEQEGYLANKNYIWNFWRTLSVLAGAIFVKIRRKIDKN